MAYKVDLPRVDGGKLPLIGERNSLVSPTQSISRKLSTESSTWASEIRHRIRSKIKSGDDILDAEVDMLRQEIALLFITALQKDDRGSWSALRDALPLAQPFCHLLADKPDLAHYLERVVHHLDVNKERLFDLNVLDAINKVFPKEAQQVSNVRPAQVYCAPTPPRSVAGPKRKLTARFLLPDGKDPYMLENPSDKDAYKPKSLTLGDLRASIPDVAFELATREAIWSACVNNSMMFTQLPEMDEPDETQISPEMPESPLPSARSVKSPRAPTPRALLSGRDAVQYFTKCYHTGKIKYMYFNLAPTRHYRPYDLVEVPKDKVNPEHYVFSTFGVLHVVPNEPNENQSLTDWQKEAVLFKAISAIPFYRNYLIRKMFLRWHSNVQYLSYSGMRKQVSLSLLPAVPTFAAALLQVSRLCQDMHRISLLPLDTSKRYQLLEFENAVNYINLQAEKIMDRFYRYNRIIVDTTSQETYKKLAHCQEQVKHKTVFSKESLHLQRKKKEHREENLRKAMRETERLVPFAHLVDQVLLSHLIQLARHCVTSFVHNTLQVQETGRDGFFNANLVFTIDSSSGEDILGISPGREKFRRVMARTLADIPSVLCDAAIPMDTAVNPPANMAITATTEQTSPEPSQNTSSRVISIKDMMRDPKKRKPAASLSHHSLGSGSDMLSSRSDAKTTSMSDIHSFMASPELPRTELPTKDIDDMGIATPDMVEQNSVGTVEEIPLSSLRNSALTKENLKEKLKNDEAYQRALTVQEQLMTEAIEEVDEYCKKNTWLVPIYRFCTEWNENSLKQWKGAAAFNIEVMLSKFKK